MTPRGSCPCCIRARNRFMRPGSIRAGSRARPVPRPRASRAAGAPSARTFRPDPAAPGAKLSFAQLKTKSRHCARFRLPPPRQMCHPARGRDRGAIAGKLMFANFDFLHVVAGALVGFLVGLTGVGGGSLMTPILVLLFGVSPTTAVGTDLLFASTTKIAGSSIHGFRDSVDWKVVRRLAL